MVVPTHTATYPRSATTTVVDVHYSRKDTSVTWLFNMLGVRKSLTSLAATNLAGPAMYAEPALQLATEQVGLAVSKSYEHGAVAGACDSSGVVTATACQIDPEARTFHLVGSRVCDGAVGKPIRMSITLANTVSLTRYAHYAALVFAHELMPTAAPDPTRFADAFNKVVVSMESSRVERMTREVGAMRAPKEPQQSVFAD